MCSCLFFPLSLQKAFALEHVYMNEWAGESILKHFFLRRMLSPSPTSIHPKKYYITDKTIPWIEATSIIICGIVKSI
jgi:hypothetical protein